MTDTIEILVVEDDKGDVVLIRKAFDKLGDKVNVTVLENGEQAIAYMKAEGIYHERARPNIVFVDLSLPKVDGHEILRFIKTHESFKRIPVIILTSSALGADIKQAYEQHANAYVQKPRGVEGFQQFLEAFKSFWLTCVILPPK